MSRSRLIQQLHKYAGAPAPQDDARERGIGGLLALGESTAHTVAGFGEGARHFASAEDLISALRRRLAPEATVLVKGSRFMRMERVVEALTGEAVGVH